MHEMWKGQQVHEDAKEMHRTEVLVRKLGKMGKRDLGAHDLVRRVDRQCEVLIWCRNARAMRGRECDQNR